jgi:hydroxyethylthiazole kinase-like uncharacterized protein yjeF
MRRLQHAPHRTVVLSREGVRALDRAAVEELGIPGIVLMENAGVSLCGACTGLIRERSISRIGIVCGPGNNGGDGLVLARHLSNRGFDPLVALTAAPGAYTGDAATNLRIVESMGLRILDPIVSMAPQAALEILHRDGRDHGAERDPRDVLLVDAMLGTGLDRPVRAPMDQAVRWMNGLRARGASVLAVDLPTGMDCDTGLPIGEHIVHADVTVTLAGMKKGFLEPQSRRWTGSIVVGDIGVPPSLAARFAEDLRWT